MKPNVLLVDDDAAVREMLKELLGECGCYVHEAEDKSELDGMMASKAPDLVLLDLVLPDANGVDLIPRIKRQWSDSEVVVLTGHATFESAVETTKRGAYTFLNKPVDFETLRVTVDRALEHRRLNETSHLLRQALASLNGETAPIFKSAAMKGVVKTIQRVASSDIPVLLVGESGTGKEVMADLVHQLSARYQGPCIKVNCAALPRELIESELFGAIKGAYTGALTNREGLFSQAHQGTLVLDELPEMPIETQSKLLRVLQDKEYRPVGARRSYRSDCRIIAATNRKVEDAISEGALREDLYYRISTMTVELPALRDRREDIMPLAKTFLKRFAAQAGRPTQQFSPEAARVIQEFDWPGNVRQLQNEIHRAVLLCDHQEVQAEDLSISAKQSNAELESDQGDPSRTLMEKIERNTIAQMLKETNGNKVEAAKRLGIGRQTLYNKIKSLEIKAP